MDLDELLRRSAPPNARHSPALDRTLDRLVVATEAHARAPRRLRRFGFVAAATTGVVGLGTVGAVAAGLVTGWVPWATESGRSCQMQFIAQPRGDDGEPATVEYPAADQQRAADEARRFLADFDYRSIDTSQAIAQWQRSEDAAIAATVPGEQQPRLDGADLELSAVGRVVWLRLQAHLEAEGFARPADAVGFAQAWRCE